MKVMTIGGGFIADHLPYGKIQDRVKPDSVAIKALLVEHTPDVLINCIGRTGSPNIDWCEAHPMETYGANTIIPLMLAEACSDRSIKMVHIGSGCIYYGESPHEGGWREDDAAAPLSLYSKTKYATDMLIGGLDNVTILRLRMPISHVHSPRNLIDKLKRYSEVIDEPNSVTYLSDLVRAVEFSIEKDLKGIYHVCSEEPVTARQVMEAYRVYNPLHTFKTISLGRLNQLTVAPRSNCILNSQKIQSAGFEFKGSLEETMRQYCEATTS